MDFRAGILGLQAQTLQNQALITGLQTPGAVTPGPLTTGQAFGFQTHLPLFQNQMTAGQQGALGMGQPTFGLGAAAPTQQAGAAATGATATGGRGRTGR
jgi:hypothetical protein